MTMQLSSTNAEALSSPDGSSGTPVTVADPVIILALPRSFGSLVSAILGQHSQVYALPETHLFLADTLREWWDLCAQSSFNMAHGLLRVVAQLYFGEQSEDGVHLAEAWLRRRMSFTTAYILELFGERVHPQIIVENSPSIVFHVASMQRAQRMFPQARFIHLVQHPRIYGDNIIAAVKETASYGSVPQWLLQLASYPPIGADLQVQATSDIDPQRAWYALNANICEFLDTVPRSQRLLFRCEDLLTDPRESLGRILNWLDLQINEGTIEDLQHPECSPYAHFGPPSARYGNDPYFLQNPSLPPAPGKPNDLDDAVTWRDDGACFLPEVRQLAKRFGYK